MKRRTISSLVVAAALIGGVTLTAAPAASAATSGVLSAYTLVTPTSVSKSKLQARAVLARGLACPNLVVKKSNGSTMTIGMKERAPGATTAPAFDSLKACKANIPQLNSGISSARVGAISIPFSLPATFDKLVMFGDTGCRINTNSTLTYVDIQDCTKTSGTDPADYWPLSKNAASVAKEKADLTIFTGDFFYREDPCPSPAQYQAICGGSPPPIAGYEFNDTDYGWMADVFAPMAPVFQAAPILAVRGNHEQCDRGGNGWFLFFEVTTALPPSACAPPTVGAEPSKNITPSWAFDAPITKNRKLRIVSVDSNEGENFEITSWVNTQRPQYQAAANLSTPKKGRESWLLTHRPIFGIEPVEQADPGKLQWTSVDQTAASQGLISNFQMIVGSHIHISQVVKIPGYPVQLVVGNGGSKPDISTVSSYTRPPFGPMATATGAPLDPAYPPYPNATYNWTQVKYGYTVMTPGKKAKQWTATQRDYTGKTFAKCSLVGQDMTCNDTR